MILFLQIILFFITYVRCEYNFTYEIAAKCKEHVVKNGYNYDVMYKVDPGSKPLPENVTFEMHLAILAASNGHILLSAIEAPTSTTPVYEFVVGGGNNSFTQLRLLKRAKGKADQVTRGILSPINFVPFRITIFKEGLIEFAKEGEKEPLIAYKNPEPLDIKYFSFAAWRNVPAKFLYDCPVAGEIDEEEIHNSTLVKATLTPMQQLKADLLSSDLAMRPPKLPLQVTTNIDIQYLKYNALEAKLETSFILAMYWENTNLKWNMYKYNNSGLIEMIMSPDEVWTPKLTVLNSDDSGFIEMDSQMPLYMLFYGLVVAKFKTNKKTWCGLPDGERSKWPRDEYMCNIYIASWTAPITLSISVGLDNDSLADHFFSHEWDVLNVTQEAVLWKNSPFKSELYPNNNFQTSNRGNLIKFSIHIRRKNSVNLMLYTPLLLMMYFLVFSYWTEPFSELRIWYYSCLIIANIGMLSYLEINTPGYIIPEILVLYIATLFCTIFALLSNALMRTRLMDPIYHSDFVDNLLSNGIIRFLFQLKSLKASNPYNNVTATPLEDDQIEITRGFEEMETETSNEFESKREFVQVLECLLLCGFLIIFSLLLGCHF